MSMTSIVLVMVKYCRSQFKCNYLVNKVFRNFLRRIWNLHQFLNILKKRPPSQHIPKLWIAKDVIRQMFKRSCFRTPFQSQHGKGSQTLLQSPQQHLYPIFSSLRGIMNWKISLLVICEILGVLVKKLTVNNKYFLRNSWNLPRTNSNAII